MTYGKDDIVCLLGTEWDQIGDLLSGLDDASWSAPALPGWDVHAVVAHLIGTERMLAGKSLPRADGATGDHVRNDIGLANERWVAALRGLPPAQMLTEFRAIAAERLASLTAMPAADFDAPSWTPAGEGTYGRWMQIRVFDCWMHEQDIRAAVRVPGHEAGPVAECSLDEVVGALGYIIGKRGRAPDGSSVLIRLTGPLERDLRVVTSGRAKVVDSIDGEPTATISLPSSLFLRLAGGREDPEAALARIELDGDVALARQLAMSLAFTI
ncbi:MAG TPA: maleylpyruvate isomerase family mycothiol-dependent enzyme [Streptosporangiaceae bacterium]|nr:maleylpyruvate isomerase family mycothiol-dependent enzyme [Streptosporangiaceae bacterium]